MNENRVLEKFRRQKIITIGQLVKWLKCSVITARRRLKKWQVYTSINNNGRYYTLPQIPVFNENGLWRYRKVLFSKHGNLKQTIVALITESEKGLSAVEIAELVDRHGDDLGVLAGLVGHAQHAERAHANDRAADHRCVISAGNGERDLLGRAIGSGEGDRC